MHRYVRGNKMGRAGPAAVGRDPPHSWWVHGHRSPVAVSTSAPSSLSSGTAAPARAETVPVSGNGHCSIHPLGDRQGWRQAPRAVGSPLAPSLTATTMAPPTWHRRAADRRRRKPVAVGTVKRGPHATRRRLCRTEGLDRLPALQDMRGTPFPVAATACRAAPHSSQRRHLVGLAPMPEAAASPP